MIVLVTGSRTYDNPGFINELFDKAHSMSPIEFMVLGDCPTGVDSYVLIWAKRNNIPHVVHEADWTAHGRAAGPLRNTAMVEDFLSRRMSDPWVVAITDKPLAQSRGTNNCFTTAKRLVPEAHFVHYLGTKRQ